MRHALAESETLDTTLNRIPRTRNRTNFLSGHSVKRQWILIDANNLVLGRLAAFIAHRLRGKHRADYTPNVNCGDFVVVINAEKVVLTGKKESDKIYYRHTNYPGGLKSASASTIRKGKNPQRLLWLAVKRMLSRGPLANKQMSRLKIYCTPHNPHSAQVCQTLDFANCNRKNVGFSI